MECYYFNWPHLIRAITEQVITAVGQELDGIVMPCYCLMYTFIWLFSFAAEQSHHTHLREELELISSTNILSNLSAYIPPWDTFATQKV